MNIGKNLLVGLLSFLFTSLSVLAQAPSGPTVQSIDVQYAGPASISRERILANMRTQVGKPYNQQAVEEDIRNLYATGTISNVRIFGERVGGDAVKVIVVVQPKATVSEVVFEGATRIKESRLRKEISTKQNEPLSEANVEADRQKILELYAGRGYSDTRIETRIDADEKTGKSRVVFSIVEGGKVVIRDIRFEGNTALKESQLRKVIKTKPANVLSFITKAGRLQQEQVEADVAAIRELYQNQGYVDVIVSGPQVQPVSGDKADLVFTIQEGRQYTLGKVNVTGAQVFTSDEVRTEIRSVPGETFSPGKLREDAKRVQDLYGARGYVDMQVGVETVSGGPGVIDVSFTLDEGTQSYVERVNIQGNTRTKDKVIRRELALSPGDIYNTVLVDASRQRLQNLNYFSRAEIFPSETDIPGRKDLNVLVEEKRTGSFNFGAGFSSIDSLLGFAEIQQSNFDITRWPNFTGGGQRFRTRLQYGTKRQDFIIGLTEPWFMDYQVAVGGELFYRKASFISSVYDQGNAGFELNARKAVGKFSSARLAYRLENISIEDVDEDASQIFHDEEGDYLKSSITAGWNYDTRDSVFLTRRGHRVDFSAYVAGGPLGGDTDTYGFNLEASKYFPLPGDTIFLINAEIGTVDSWSGGERVPIFDRLYLGGANTLRGFDYRDVGPKDEDGEPIGGNTLARVTFEYTFPVVDRIRGALFYDTGFVNAGSYEFSPSDVNSDVGIGVRIELPIGPIRLDYGIPVQSDSHNDSSGKFNFNIGYQF